MTGNEDAQVVASVLAGDRDAFARLVNRYQAEIFRLAFRSTRNRHDAEDLTQESFLRAYRSLERFDPARPFRTWLYGIAVYACRDAARRRARGPRPVEADDPLEGVADGGAPGPADLTLAREQSTQVTRALFRLDPEYRLLVVLYYQEERSQAEIAEWLGLSLTTVKNRLYRARKRLERMLSPYLSPEEVGGHAVETDLSGKRP